MLRNNKGGAPKSTNCPLSAQLAVSVMLALNTTHYSIDQPCLLDVVKSFLTGATQSVRVEMVFKLKYTPKDLLSLKIIEIRKVITKLILFSTLRTYDLLKCLHVTREHLFTPTVLMPAIRMQGAYIQMRQALYGGDTEGVNFGKHMRAQMCAEDTGCGINTQLTISELWWLRQ